MASQDKNLKSYFPLRIQISAKAWAYYGLTIDLARELPSSPLYPLRRLAECLQRKNPARPASAGQLNLLALLNTAFRFVVTRYLEQRRCSIGMEEASIAGRRISLPPLRSVLEAFVTLFPPDAVWRGVSNAAFLEGKNASANRESTLVELFILAVQAANPAAADLADLFEDVELSRCCRYQETLTELDGHLRQESAPGLLSRSLLELLRAPIQAAPHSLISQLEYIQQHWAELLPPDLLRTISTAFDVLREELQPRGFGPGPIEAPLFRREVGYEEPERFSPDADWMSNVVLIAKSVYVWLDQLSKKYRRSITKLDEIPDEELDILIRRGFTGLWLIGLWERSPASQKIKQIMGNPEAVSSAYSLYDYVVAWDLGGEEALGNLHDRCTRRGIRLACDVVPNHTGIYSKWIREHPDWFIQLDYPPYPKYQFTGPNLSFSEDVSIFIEDGFWDHSEAAVIFKHVNNHTGQVRYIYHGNDGTHLPWNDTAQLNFLLPEVREAMIQTILHVARKFKVIRFDAAMTLAKKHYQRLWFPQPGGGAGVPSRAEYWMSREDFDRAFPVEFWREVVDRVAAEVPDTLLLAEAFWLMEGYFVRTLGMHRVYNSAFMNMLKMEDNAKYRSAIKNILEFNHEILKRFVNFMSNPDEATAVEQFGTGDKYFGVAILLVTMPGLPMFGHGQVEGFKEKYGMEYRKAYWDEVVDEGLVRHHEAQIFPLMRRRHLFSGSENFVLYDFFSGDYVNEDVFAYSNRRGEEKALVVYHNRYSETSGWIRNSVSKKERDASGQENLVRTTLGEALGIGPENRNYFRFRDFRTGLEYLRHGQELCQKGLFLQLGFYQYYVFLNFQEIVDKDGNWERLCHRLDGQPVPSLDFEWKKLCYALLLEIFGKALSPRLLKKLGALVGQPADLWEKEPAFLDFTKEIVAFFTALGQAAEVSGDADPVARRVLDDLATVRQLAALKSRNKKEREALEAFCQGLPDEVSSLRKDRQEQFLRVFLPWLVVRRIGELELKAHCAERSSEWLEEYLLIHTLQKVLQSEDEPPFNLSQWAAAGEALLVQILTRYQSFGLPDENIRHSFAGLLKDPRVQTFLGFNWFGGNQWFNKERLEMLTYWLFFIASLQCAHLFEKDQEGLLSHLGRIHQYLARCRGRAEAVQFQVEKFFQFI
jgi:glycosidase